MCYSYNLPIGIIGAFLGTALTCFAIHKFIIFLDRRMESKDEKLRAKKMTFHILIIFAAALDVPLAFSLAIICDYNPITYGFHHLQPPVLFAALSVTVRYGSDMHDCKRLTLCVCVCVFQTVFGAAFCTIYASFKNGHFSYVISVFS